MNNELAVRESVKAEISGFEMKPRSLKEAMDFCDLMANSDLVPNSYKGKPGNIMVAIQMGSELGLTPMRALRSIAVINGRATMWGDDVLAMVLNSPLCEYVNETESTDTKGVCKVKRKGTPEHISVFSLEDAKRAGLLGKQGPWQTNTKRMLTLRARGFGLRDKFADVLAGLVSTEEALDLPAVEAETPAENILEAAQPLTLKDKLKAKVEAVEPTQSVLEPSTAEALQEMGHAQEDLCHVVDSGPSAPYRTKIQHAKTAQEATHAYNATPEELRQDVWKDFQDALKSFSKKK